MLTWDLSPRLYHHGTRWSRCSRIQMVRCTIMVEAKFMLLLRHLLNIHKWFIARAHLDNLELYWVWNRLTHGSKTWLYIDILRWGILRHFQMNGPHRNRCLGPGEVLRPLGPWLDKCFRSLATVNSPTLPSKLQWTIRQTLKCVNYGTPNSTKMSCLCRLDRSSFSVK